MTQVGRGPARLALPTLVLGLAAMIALPASSSVAKPFFVNVPTVKANNGYKASVIAGGSVPGPYVALEVRKGGARAAYEGNRAKVKVSRLSVSIGPRGTVNLKVRSKSKPKAIPVPKKCTGKPGKRFRVTYKGTIRFNGEGGFTKVNVKKAKGTITYNPVIKKCKGNNNPGPEREYAGFYVYDSFDADGRTHLVYANGSRRNTSASKAEFFASTHEDHAKYSVFRSVFVKNRPTSSLVFDTPYTTSSITPGTSWFSGTATLNGDSGTPTGNLMVHFPGRRNISLGGGPSALATFEIFSSS